MRFAATMCLVVFLSAGARGGPAGGPRRKLVLHGRAGRHRARKPRHVAARGAGRAVVERRAPALEQRTYRVAARGRYVFAATTSGLVVLERDRKGGLSRVGGLLLPDSATDMALSGRRLLLAQGSWGLAVLDVSKPDRPRLRQRLTFPGSATAVVAHGKQAFVGLGTMGLAVVSLGRKGARVASRMDLPEGCYVWGLALSKKRLAVACGRAGVLLYEVSRTGGLTEKGRLSVGTSFGARARSVAFSGRRLAVAAGKEGALVFDVKGSGGKPVCRLPVRDFARSVAWRGDLLAVAEGQSGLSVARMGRRTCAVATARLKTHRAVNHVLPVGRAALLAAHDSDGVLSVSWKKAGLVVRAAWPKPPEK